MPSTDDGVVRRGTVAETFQTPDRPQLAVDQCFYRMQTAQLSVLHSHQYIAAMGVKREQNRVFRGAS